MKKLIMAVVIGCLAASISWGRSFSIDLRQPVARPGTRAVAKFNALSSVVGDSGFVRRVNLEALSADVGAVEVGDELTFALFDDVTITLTLKSQMPSPLGGDVFLAEASGYEGVKNAVVMRTADGLTVDIQDYLNKKVYKVISTASGVTVQEMESTGVGCGCDALEPKRLAEESLARPRKAKEVVAAKSVEGTTLVDILVAYDNGATMWANDNGGGTTNFAHMAVQKMNAVLANNGLDDYFQFRLVGVVSVAASSTDIIGALTAATYGNAGWTAIRTARDEVGADIVTVLIDTGTADGNTGIGWTLDTNDFGAFSEYAYNCCAIRSVAQSHTMTHEVGHNMGCGHATEQRSSPGPQLYSYSAGYYFTGNDSEKYCTIMAYVNDGPGGEQIPYYSSPAHIYAGVPVGDRTHNNCLTLQNTYAAVSQWRDAKGSEIGGDDDTPSETLDWLTSRAEVFAKARAEGKNVFLISGRDSCANTMATRDYSCEDPSVKRYLLQDYVCWYNNCDTQMEESYKYFSEYDVGNTLPFIAIVDASKDETLVAEGGYHTADDLLLMLDAAAKDVMVLVTFNANGGSVTPGSRSVVVGSVVGSLPTPSRSGYAFAGWWTAASGGMQISVSTTVTGDVTYYAHWTRSTPSPAPTPEDVHKLYVAVNGVAPTAAASEYNGYLYEEKSGEEKGTIQVKVGKPNAKTGLASVKAVVQLADGAKKNLKGAENGKAAISVDGPTKIQLVGGEACTVVLGADGLSGSYGAFVLDGARNFFTSKDKGEVSAANAVLGKWLGSAMIVWDGGLLSVNIAAKGKVKASGTLASGAKVSASTVLLVGEEWSCVSVVVPKENLASVLWLSHDGKTIEVEGLGDGVNVGLPGTLAEGSAFYAPTDDVLWDTIPGDVHTEYLPDGVPVVQKDTKWTLPRAGKVTMKKGEIDDSKAGDNPSGLKLTYKAKDGSFKGSFKVYAEVNGRLKATTVNVTGFLLDGIGYGTATIKGKGSVAVTIE